MAVEGDYLGMSLEINVLDVDNLAYFEHCAAHDFHLQRCADCDLLTYPARPSCPHCAGSELSWVSVEGKGVVHSYSEVHHAIQPAFKPHAPYLILLVELDVQRDAPNAGDALRVAGNLTTADGDLAPLEAVKQVGIGSRVRMVFKDVSDGLSLPMWTLDADAEQPDAPWRYPQE